MLELGKEIRLLSHNKINTIRDLCGWPTVKDDPHDAVCCAYYGWMHIDNLSAFNFTRRPELASAYLKFLEKERLVRELRPTVNRGWNMLSYEFPEGDVNRDFSIDPKPIWGFIAGKPISKRATSVYSAKLATSVGSAARNGFSAELIRRAAHIYDLQHYRLELKQEFDEFLGDPQYQWLKPTFDEFGFTTFERIIFLCQFDPFEQFLDSDLRELRLEKKRHRGQSGKCITRRLGLAKFHARMGKAVYPWSSGEKEGHIVSGSQLARNHWHLWVYRSIVLNFSRTGNKLIEDLKLTYSSDVGLSKMTLSKLIALDDKDLIEGLDLLKDSTIGKVFIPLISEALSRKKSPLNHLKQKGTSRLNAWARSRVSDRAVKILFKRLTVAIRAR